MKYTLEAGLLALVLAVAIYLPLYMDFQVPIYFAWLIGASVSTFAFYGLDKVLSRFQRVRIRVPELVLNLMALAGGFVGAWLGRLVWRHKTNVRRHSGMLIVLVVSTLLHVGGIYVYVRYFGQ